MEKSNYGDDNPSRQALQHMQAEALIREYLLFRGFTQSLRAFETELSSDLAQGYQIDRIVDLFFNVYISRFEIDKMLELMQFLCRTVFAAAVSGDMHTQNTVRKLESALKKYYMVYAMQKERPDRVLQFFEKFGDSLLKSGEDWHAWFAIPYLKNPSTDPRFQVYFTKEWLDTLMVSFRNFLSEVLDDIRMPVLLKLISRRDDSKALKQQYEQLMDKCSRLEASLVKGDEEISKLKSMPSTDPANYTSNNLRESSVIEPKSSLSSSSSVEDTPQTPTTSNLEASTSVRWHQTDSEKRDADNVISHDKDEACLFNVPDNDHVEFNSCVDDEFAPVNVDSQECFSGHTSPITQCRFSATGANIASASVDGTVRIWSPETVGSTSRNATIYCGVEILSLDWEHKSDRLLVLGTADRGIKAWNVDAKRVICDLPPNPAFPRVLDIKCSPTEPVFVSAESSVKTNNNDELIGFGSLTVWNMRVWKAVNVLPLGEDPPVVTSVCFNHNGKMVAAAATDGMIRLYDMNGCLPLTGWPAHDGCAVSCVRFGPNQTSIFSMGADGKVYEWSLHNQGKILQTIDASRFLYDSTTNLPHYEMALESQGNAMLLTSSLNYSPIYHFGQKIRAFKTLEHQAAITTVDWHPFSKTFLTGSADHSVRVTYCK